MTLPYGDDSFNLRNSVTPPARLCCATSPTGEAWGLAEEDVQEFFVELTMVGLVAHGEV